ncbi:hypothetical protein [Bradyrhizobium sp. I71]|uniref:hypothetical protein n=1 Tax=Bradyrhizobium sp. I71 TaxID=2590772 RepID=UPI001EF7B522|nr:hypothetical protein [Bradyrhizobium sp. I71]ULK98755.1 hypothetical protein FJV43_03110 [Bradyrhizobium sp. I71]
MLKLLVKAHVAAYTMKDETFVAAHEDKRTKHSPEQMAKWAEEKQAQIKARADAEAANKDARQEDVKSRWIIRRIGRLHA